MPAPTGNIIIKKIKKSGHAHHGGAWKVAYADFVTAMMSFFLLLWLLTATPVENLKGLADYFSPTLGLQGKLGIGFAGGRAPDAEGFSQANWASMGLVFGSPPSGPIIKFPDKDNNTDEENPRVDFGKVNESVTQDIKESKDISDFKDNVLIEQTPEGLKINITDTEKRPMFEAGSAELTDAAKKILAKIASLVKDIPNYIQISGSTNSVNYSKDDNYTNWELSTERANSARRYLMKVGVDSTQIARVLGLADQENIDKEHPDSPQNSRVTITLLRKTIIAYNRQPAPEEVIMGPVESGLQTYINNTKKKEEEINRELMKDANSNIEIDPATGLPKVTPETKHFDDNSIDNKGQAKHTEKKKEKKKDDKPRMKKKKKKASSESH